MKVRCDVVRSVNYGHEIARGDSDEREQIVKGVEEALSTADVDYSSVWTNKKLLLKNGSSMERLHTPASKIVKEIVFSLEFHGRFSSPVFFDRVLLDSDKHLQGVMAGGTKLDVSYAVEFVSLLMGNSSGYVVDMIRESGEEVNLGYQCVTFEHWLRFHGLQVPAGAKEARELLTLLEWQWPVTDGLSNYWGQLIDSSENAVVLTTAQCAAIRALTADYLPDGKALLDVLYQEATGRAIERVRRGQANYAIKHLLWAPSSQAFAKKYLHALNWYGAGENEPVNETDLAQLLATVLILDLDPTFGIVEKRNHVGIYDIYAPVVVADQKMEAVRDSFEQYLVQSGRVSNELCSVASHLLLGLWGAAFLVKASPSDITIDLTVGSIGWLSFCQAVALVDASCPGASRYMRHDEVMQFAGLESVSRSLEQLQGIVAVDPVIDWALVNGVINHDDLSVSSEKTLERAMTAYGQYVDGLVSASKAFSTPLPNRKKLALAALKLAAPGYDLESKTLRNINVSISKEPQISLVDAYIAGELSSRQWDSTEGKSIYTIYPNLTRLVANQTAFEAEVVKYHGNLQKAVEGNIKLSMSVLPKEHRAILESNEVMFFTLRSYVGQQRYATSTGYIGTGAGTPRMMETQRQRDEATGRYGIVLYVAYGNNQFLCYEILYLQGECRLNQELGLAISRSWVRDADTRIGFKGRLGDFVPSVSAYNYPVDFKAHSHGTVSKSGTSSFVVIDKLGSLAAPAQTRDGEISAYQFFKNAHINDVAQFIVRHHPVATVEDIIDTATVLTEREKFNKNVEEIFICAVNLIVPFKKCIEDLNSGDMATIEEGAWGCSLDAIGIISSVLGAPAKLIEIAGKSVGFTSRLCQYAKFGLGFIVAVLNPLDGLPTAVYRGTKCLFNGVLRLNVEGLKLLKRATRQVGLLTGTAKTHNLLEAAKGADCWLGAWRPLNSLDAQKICAIRRGGDWYAINQHGRAWGERLIGFASEHLRPVPRLLKALPETIARQILYRVLPLARRKIDITVSALAAPHFRKETELVTILFLGKSGRTREKFDTILQLVTLELGSASTRNFVLEGTGHSDALLQVIPDQYKAWKNEGMSGVTDYKFLNVQSQNLIDRFIFSGASYGEVADDLNHEMFRAVSSALDIVSARTSIGRTSGLDVAGLLNLAKGHLPVVENGQPTGRFHDSQQALSNADSCAMAVALLSQLMTDTDAALKNLELIKAAVNASPDKAIDTEVMVQFNN